MLRLHYLRLLVRDQEDLIFEVAAEESERLRLRLAAADEKDVRGFHWFNTADDRSVVINLDRLQAVRFLWDVTPTRPDPQPASSEIRIKLIGKEPVVEDYTEDPEDIYDLFTHLESDLSPWPSFLDMDGEMMFLRADQVEWIIAPKHVIEQGSPEEEDDEPLAD